MLLVTGGAGFLGGHVVRKLVERGTTPCCFVRSTSDVDALNRLRIPLRYGDLAAVDSFTSALAGVDTLVNIASLGFGHAPAILQACRRAGVKRGIFVSTTAVFTTLEAKTKSIRLDAEGCIQQSGLDWTIIRPTMIYGTARDRNMARLIRFVARSPLIPVLGAGKHLQQPIHVEDLADVIIAALDSPVSQAHAYNVSGREPVTYNQVIDQTAQALGRRIWKVHLPVLPAVRLLRAYERVVSRPLFKAEQVLRLNENKAFSHEEAVRDLGFAPRSFKEGITAEVQLMRTEGLV